MNIVAKDLDARLRIVRKFATAQPVSARQIRIVVSDGGLDRDGDRMNLAGINLDNYKKHPIVLAFHDPTCPVGTATLEKSDGQLIALMDFLPAGTSAKADEICALAKSGVLAASLGFTARKGTPTRTGVDWEESELIEISLVTTPANPRALLIDKSYGSKGHPMNYALPMSHDYENPTAVLGGVMRLCATGPNTRDKYERIEHASKSFGVSHPVTRTYSKALSLASGSGGVFIIPPEMQQDIVQRLLPKSVCRKAGAQSIDSPRGNLTLPTVTAGTASYWLPTAGVLTLAQGAFGQIASHARKLAILVPISNDLLRFGVESTDEQIGALLLDEAAAAEDLAFLRADGTSNQPVGLKGFIGRTGAIIASNATFTPVTVLSELKACLQLLLSASVPMTRGAWVFHPSVELFLRTLANAEGIYVFAHEMSRGTLLGQKFFSTTQIPNTLGSGGNASEIYCCDFNELLLFSGPESEIVTSSTGGEWMDVNTSQLTGGFTEDCALIRVILGRDAALKHAVSAAMISGVVWS